ncbi:MAG: sulfatase-like hydrolase/transferase [Kiritimatiellaceae bacterium]|nr:sulfatase-like hydrolase/transferase [Kiritimatiellaceae bacterium]
MKKPNFLIILTDQQRFDTLAAAGFPWMKTPNLDRLVHEGCLFKNAYTTNPICVPARYDMLTGKTGRAHGHFDNASILLDENLPTFPRELSAHGWRTAVLGKCHFNPPTAHHGYDEQHLMEEIPERVEDDAYLQYLKTNGYGDLRNIHGIRPLLYHEAQKALIPEEHLGPNWLAGRAEEWIDQNSDQPFLLTLGWIKPHPPWNIPESKKGIYADANLPEPLERSRDLPYPSEDSDLYGDFDSTEEKRKIREAYLESVTMVDEAFGRVLAALKRNGILDNTVIIYTADHGEMLQDKGFYQKTLPYDSACRIPLVVRYPEKFKPGSVREEFADLLDIFPTLLDIAGIRLDRAVLDGESLLSNSSVKRKIQYAHSCQGRYRWIMTRDERYKYIYYFAGGHEYLYDMQNDPAEKNNLLGLPDCPQAVYAKLKTEAIRREQQAGPEGTVKDGEFLPDAQGRHPSFDWNNGEKYPRWCFTPGHFQQFGKKSPAEEAALFLKEFSASKDEAPHCPSAAKKMLLEAYSKVWGCDPAELEKLLTIKS